MKENEYNIPFKLFQNEILKPIEGHENYLISNMGRVWSIEREWWLISSLSGNYPTVYFDGKSHLVHRLVAQAFIPNPDNLPIVNHKDENKHNAHWENLEWCTQEYNMNYGTARQRAGENNRGRRKEVRTIEEINQQALEEFKRMENKWIGRKLFASEQDSLVKETSFVCSQYKKGKIDTVLRKLESCGEYSIRRGQTCNKSTGKRARYIQINKKNKREYNTLS